MCGLLVLILLFKINMQCGSHLDGADNLIPPSPPQVTDEPLYLKSTAIIFNPVHLTMIS